MSYILQALNQLEHSYLGDMVEAIGPPTKAHAIKLVKNLLTHRRNGNVKGEQDAHEKLVAWSQKHNINMDNTIKGATTHLGHSVAALMGGIV
jgi:hypothetical protein